jgi:hypothetical protein
LAGWTAGTALAWLGTAAARAGESLALLLAQQDQSGGTKIAHSGKNYVVEAIVTVVAFGLALFVVCRSSRRV